MKKVGLIVFFLFLSIRITSAGEIPLEYFAELPMITSAQVSPNGERIAAIHNTTDGPIVVLSDFGGSEIKNLAKLTNAQSEIDFVRWSGDRYILIGTAFETRFYRRLYNVRRIFVFDTANSNFRELTYEGAQKINGKQINKFHKVQSYYLTSTLKDDKDHVLVSTRDLKDDVDFRFNPTVFKVNLENGKFKKQFINKYEVDSWYADSKGDIRLGTQFEKEEGPFKKEEGHFVTIWYRKSNDGDFSELFRRKYGASDTFYVMGLNDGGDKAYVISNRETGRDSLWLYDIESSKFEKLVYGHDQFDLDGTLEGSDGEINGVYWYDDFKRNHYFDEADSILLSNVKKNLNNYEVSIASWDKSRKRVLVNAVGDSKAGRYAWFDFAKNTGGMWFPKYPKLEKYKHASVQSITFKASDGQEIPGYLTMPSELTPGKKPHLIVHPHGGPHSRDYKYFDNYVQFLANRGYAVLQMNFRGSSGFGTKFEEAGHFEWGKRMQQDVMDGVDWIKKQGLVSDKACIFGWSYGGYVALTSAFQTPDKFACTISVAGISDLELMVKDDQRYDGFVDYIVDGDDVKAISALGKESAINYVNKIKSPILLIHGRDDWVVDRKQSKKFYKKAKSEGKKVKYVEINKGTHSLYTEKHRMIVFKEIETFLKAHLP